MRNKTCCFTGHRNINAADSDTVKQRLVCIAEELIADDVIFYGCDGALGFDTLAAALCGRLFVDFSAKGVYNFFNNILERQV